MPQVKRKARERLLELSEPAIIQLNRILTASSTSDSDRLRAIQMILDRTGFGPGMTIEHEHKKSYEVILSKIIKEVPSDMQPQLEQWRAEQIEDAEVVEDDDDLDDGDYIPEIVPSPVPNERPTVRRGSAEPPRRSH